MNRQFKEFVTYKVLEHKHGGLNSIDYTDLDPDTVKRIEEKNEIKNVCTKMGKDLSDRIDSTVKFLDMRKRKFIELAIIQALDEADKIIGELFASDDEWIESQRTDKEQS